MLALLHVASCLCLPGSCSHAGLVAFLVAVVYKLIKPSEGHGLRGQSVVVVTEAAGQWLPHTSNR